MAYLAYPDHATVSTHLRGLASTMPLAPSLFQEDATPDYLRSAPFDASTLVDCNHLVMVCGHAITTVESLDRINSDFSWSLLPYQRNQDMPASFVSHIEAGVDRAAKDSKSLLVFSGGQSRASAGPKSEGASYWGVAEHFNWFGNAEQVRPRTVIEDYARDSFENLLFSVCRFKEVVGHYPSRFTVVGYSFKAYRFNSLHRQALGISTDAFTYIGLDPPKDSKFDLQRATQGELENAIKLFADDPYGCSDPALKEKRENRNPYRRSIPYSLSSPEIAELLAWCGPSVYDGALPWDSNAES